jgi:hypothetical protein
MLPACRTPSGFEQEQSVAHQLSAREFETRYRVLVGRLARERDNDGCVECERCAACSYCTFCRDSERLVRCHFCVRCSMSSDSSHCRGSRGLIGCQHCVDCETCSQSCYLVRCLSLTSCQYCFGCVGLSSRDFHILNEPYDRKTYFEVTARLSRELKL